MKIAYYHSPVGILKITADEVGITGVEFVEEDGKNETNLFLTSCMKQLDEYFLGTRTMFDVPLHPIGTKFQCDVWNVLTTIPYGETCSYKHIATLAGNAKASRAVGMANNRNPIAIIIPCHRVIGTNGKLVGYGGGLDKKIYLLELEQKYK